MSKYLICLKKKICPNQHRVSQPGNICLVFFPPEVCSMLSNMSGLMSPLCKIRGCKAQTQAMCYSLPQTGCVSREQTVVKQFAFIMPICTSNLWQSAGLVLLCSVLPFTIYSTSVNDRCSKSFQFIFDSISDSRSHL